MSIEVTRWSDSILKIGNEFVNEFNIDKENENEIYALSLYFNEKSEFEQFNEHFSIQKGIMLLGGVGTGKTLLMRIFQRYLSLKGKTFAYKHINQIANEYIEIGFSAFNRFDAKDLWIDEVGLFDKESVKRYGNNVNVLEELIMHRYDRFVFAGVKTHVTSNLTPAQMQSEYDPRIWSRLKEMCNMIPLTGRDRRDTAKPKNNTIAQQKLVITQEQKDKDMAIGIIEHYKLCKNTGSYQPCGIYDMLASTYYDFLDRHKIINYTAKEKHEALSLARVKNIEPESNSIKALITQTLQAETEINLINRAKGILYKDFISKNDVLTKLSKFL